MADSAALTKSNLYTQSFWNIYNLIDTRTNVLDPTDAGGKRKFTYSREPDLGRGFAGYPLVIVWPASVTRGERHTGDDKNAEISGELVIEVRSSTTFFRKITAADPHGKALTFLDVISDDVIETLNSVTNRDTLRGNNIGMVQVEGTSMEAIDVSGETVYVREIKVSFTTALFAVSS